MNPIYVGKSKENDKRILNTTKAQKNANGLMQFGGAMVRPCELPSDEYEKCLISQYKFIARLTLMRELEENIYLETGSREDSEKLVREYLSQFLNSRKQLNYFFAASEFTKPNFWDEMVERLHSPFPKDLVFTRSDLEIDGGFPKL